MTFALCLQVPNHLKLKKQSDIWTNFLPQMLFLQSIFGYLVVCILFKWSVDWSKSSTSPPSLLNMLINMFLSPGTINPDEQLYAGQSVVQTILLLIAAVCVPWLLCAKPYLQWKEMKRIHEQGYIGLSNDHDTRRISSDDTLEAEEEGDGRAIVEDMEEEHVRSFSSCGFLRFQLNPAYHRNRTTLVRWSSIRSFTQSSSVLGVYRTPPPTFDCGRYRSRMHSYPRYCGA